MTVHYVHINIKCHVPTNKRGVFWQKNKPHNSSSQTLRNHLKFTSPLQIIKNCFNFVLPIDSNAFCRNSNFPTKCPDFHWHCTLKPSFCSPLMMTEHYMNCKECCESSLQPSTLLPFSSAAKLPVREQKRLNKKTNMLISMLTHWSDAAAVLC